MSTLTVGAAGAGGAFDYTCDGTADQAEIAGALDAAGAGGTVLLSAGTFVCATTVTVPVNRVLAGTVGTVLDFGIAAERALNVNTGSVVRDLELHGGVVLTVYGSDVTIGNVVSQTITVVPGVSYGGARLSEADLAPLDHDPIANATDLQNGRVGLQGSPVSRKAWTINALADDHAEIEALAALKGQRLTLNINGTEYPGVMIRPPLLETQLTPAAWAHQVGFVQETRR